MNNYNGKYHNLKKSFMIMLTSKEYLAQIKCKRNQKNMKMI